MPGSADRRAPADLFLQAMLEIDWMTGDLGFVEGLARDMAERPGGISADRYLACFVGMLFDTYGPPGVPSS
jgi:hypothetical protein